jgi:hypothetical protein
MIESFRNSVSVTNLHAFLILNAGMPRCDPKVVLKPSDYIKYGNMTTFTKFHVKIAKIENGSIMVGNHGSANQIINAADDTASDTLEIKMTGKTTRGRDGLRVGKIRSFVDRFLPFRETKEVVTLEVSGRDDNDEPVTIVDFIKNKLTDKITVPGRRVQGTFAVQERKQLLVDVYSRHKNELAQAYRWQ